MGPTRHLEGVAVGVFRLGGRTGVRREAQIAWFEVFAGEKHPEFKQWLPERRWTRFAFSDRD